MILHWYHIDDNIPVNLVAEIKSEIQNAFDLDGNNFFEVNPKKFYKKTENGDINPAVINSAAYLSHGFQNRLKSQGWTLEKTLVDQTIDGYIQINRVAEKAVYLTRENYFQALKVLDLESPDYISSVRELVSKYYHRKLYKQPGALRSEYFTPLNQEANIRIGLEFETGNIASSFRAFAKLNLLYNQNLIDIGVFVTSKDKSISTKIWPSSNRNGSLEELEKRKFMKAIDFPSVIVGFEPDVWNPEAGFLGEDLNRFFLSDPEAKILDDVRYLYYPDREFYYKEENELF